MHRDRRAHLSIATLCALALAACTAPGSGGDEGEAASDTIVVTTATTGETGETGETATTGETGETGETTGTEPECSEDADCAEGFYCDLETNSCEIGCPMVEVEVAFTPPNVMLVLDKSGSMVTNTWDDDGDPGTAESTRWASLYQVVEAVVEGYDASMNLGMTLFPAKTAKGKYDAEACIVDDAPTVTVAPQHGAMILASMPPEDATSQQIAGGTPTRSGMIVAIDHLSALADELDDVIILVTDGAANCSPDAVDDEARFEVYDAALADLVAGAYQDGIPTYVVGVDIEDVISPVQADGNPDATNTFERLNELAVAGGVPNEAGEGELFYNARDKAELQAALDKIVMEVIPCEIALTPAPKHPLYVKEVQVDGAAVDELDACDGGDGWTFVDPEAKDALLLCGAACSAFQSSGKVNVEYGCGAV